MIACGMHALSTVVTLSLVTLSFLYGCHGSPAPSGTTSTTSSSGTGQMCDTCGIGGVYCFDLDYDTDNCGACGKACPTGKVCDHGDCITPTCTLMGCVAESVCCGGVCCAAPDFCCNTPDGPTCVLADVASTCPSNGCHCH